jgi:hypothetical protein
MTDQPETCTFDGVEYPKICPLCGGHVRPCAYRSSGGTIEYSACCDGPLDIIGNWEVYADLPEPLQKAALQQEEDRRAALRARWAQEAAAFKAAKEHWDATYGHLMKKESEPWL